MRGASDLLRSASRCYRAAGWDDDACRCLERAGDHPGAARLHEHAGRWGQAAEHHVAARDWTGAARCYLRLGRPDLAGDAFVEADDRLSAAWAFADGAHLFERARAVVAGFTPGRPT